MYGEMWIIWVIVFFFFFLFIIIVSVIKHVEYVHSFKYLLGVRLGKVVTEPSGLVVIYTPLKNDWYAILMFENNSTKIQNVGLLNILYHLDKTDGYGEITFNNLILCMYSVNLNQSSQ